MEKPELPEFQRRELLDVAADLRDLLQKFQFEAPAGTHDGKDKIRLLEPALRDLSRAVSLLIARRVTMDEPVGNLSSRNFVENQRKSEREKTLGNRFPLDLSHAGTLQLEQEILRELSGVDTTLITTAVQDPTAKIASWPVTWLLAVRELLQVNHWPATPASWRRLYLFIQTDPVLNRHFEKIAARRTNSPKCERSVNAEILLDEVREETYLTSINAAENRARNNGITKRNGQPIDARAEIKHEHAVRKQAKAVHKKPEYHHKQVDEIRVSTRPAMPQFELMQVEFRDSLPRLLRMVLEIRIETNGEATAKLIAQSLNEIGHARLNGFQEDRPQLDKRSADTDVVSKAKNTDDENQDQDFARTLAAITPSKVYKIMDELKYRARDYFGVAAPGK